MDLKNVHILLHEMWYVSLHRKRDIADVIKLRVLGWGDYIAPMKVIQNNYKGPYNRDKEAKSQTRCEPGSRDRRAVGPGAQRHRQLLEAGNGPEIDSPLELPGGKQCPCIHLGPVVTTTIRE